MGAEAPQAHEPGQRYIQRFWRNYIMAKATADCVCRICGEHFTRTQICRNRKDADSWEEWAAKTFDLCPEHYKEEQRAKESAKGLIGRVYANKAKTKANCAIWLTMAAFGNSYDCKEQLKAAGYHFGIYDPYDQDPDAGNKAWNKAFSLEDSAEAVAEFEKLGGRVEFIEPFTFSTLQSCLHDALREREAASAMEESGNGAPDCYPKGQWNGKIYGSKGRFRIYVDREPQELTDAEVSAIKDYQDRLEVATMGQTITDIDFEFFKSSFKKMRKFNQLILQSK